MHTRLDENDTARVAKRIALTLIVTFVLAFGFLYWRQKAFEGPAPATPSMSLMRAATSVPLARTAPPMAAPVTATPAAAVVTAATPNSPVSVHLWNRRRLGTIEGRVSNDSDKPLTVVLEGKDRGGAVSASVFFELNPGEQKSFSTDDGLQLDGGGTVVARVTGYADQEVGIPL
jgi:hypothetical protein